MKRRNAEIGKMRRPMKRNKITEGIYGSTLLYLKFLVLWVLVILADFILEFRFEFLWPFYLLLRSVYDSFKYQGLAFSIFFVCIALTSDMLCFFFIPVHWLFFAASTYVWVQYVWHTDKGICAPTVILWVLFVYLEAAVRLRDVKHMPGHLDLCRPFAAHCIGYPVVTLGFGFKSYIGYRMRQRKQRDVAKENEFYMQLMQQALPLEAVTPPPAAAIQQQQSQPPQQPPEQPVSSSTAIVPAPVQTAKVHNNSNSSSSSSSSSSNNSGKSVQQERNGHIPNGTIANGHVPKSHHRKSVDKCKEQQHDDHKHHHIDRQRVNHSHSNGAIVGSGVEEAAAATTAAATTTTMTTTSNRVGYSTVTAATSSQQEHEQRSTRRREKKEQDKEREATEYLQKLEADAKRLRADLQSSRASEQELRLQVAALTTSEKVSKGELTSMQREIEDLQQRYHSVVSSRTSDREKITNLERRMAEEKRARCSLESQLAQERKSRKQEEARAAQVVAQSTRGECTEACRARRRELEAELGDCRASKHWAEERYAALERENAALVDQLRDMDILMTALSAMQEKNAHLENSLSAETRIKLDLFSALGEAKRQLEIRESSNRTQEREIEELKSKIAQVLAVMPNDSFGGPPAPAAAIVVSPPNAMPRVRLAESPPGSTLDPNATAYTPKGSLVASTEA